MYAKRLDKKALANSVDPEDTPHDAATIRQWDMLPITACTAGTVDIFKTVVTLLVLHSSVRFILVWWSTVITKKKKEHSF
ncbi:hypothetical protein DPMN_167265 [Dreissena polymorpha]|uniref:Uncharacterized protein n=1 Tax=Dreissena polymorpha TaxID=45954 RepID=A0A9D4IUW2_DREPO|nr:hypothetical protein DPMN_167265 [Dreissena polymorpha]